MAINAALLDDAKRHFLRCLDCAESVCFLAADHASPLSLPSGALTLLDQFAYEGPPDNLDLASHLWGLRRAASDLARCLGECYAFLSSHRGIREAILLASSHAEPIVRGRLKESTWHDLAYEYARSLCTQLRLLDPAMPHVLDDAWTEAHAAEILETALGYPRISRDECAAGITQEWAAAKRSLVVRHDEGSGGSGGGSRGKKSKREWQAKAMLTVQEHPEWSDARIAKAAEIDPSRLSRNETYQKAAAMAREPKRGRNRGHVVVDRETRKRSGVEAIAPPAERPDDKSDRGQQIPGSRYYQEYCAECNEPIRVAKEKVGTNPLCENCEAT